jgi:two-component system sensor kinase FixL
MIEPDANIQQAKLELILDPSAPEVMIDSIQIQQVVINLVRNALDAMKDIPPAQRRVVISTAQRDDMAVEISVSDSGSGIAENDLAMIFEAFYSTKKDGMGMGLAICRTIIEQHGGRLWVALTP